MVFSIFDLNPAIVVMKEPKQLLNATEVTTCKTGVKTFHVKIQNGLISYSCQICNQNPLFFIIQDCVNLSKSFYLKILFGNNFPHFNKSQSKYSSKTCQDEQN